MKSPDLTGIPAVLVKGVDKIKAATQIFPPPGVGIGVGLGMGCGIGWPLRKAYGPPRALCGPIIGAGIGFGYGQGFGRRFGKDVRSEEFRSKVSQFEEGLDYAILRFLALLGAFRGKQESKQQTE